jgi:hypothetical protein
MGSRSGGVARLDATSNFRRMAKKRTRVEDAAGDATRTLGTRHIAFMEMQRDILNVLTMSVSRRIRARTVSGAGRRQIATTKKPLSPSDATRKKKRATKLDRKSTNWKRSLRFSQTESHTRA